jgi:hypothetical protein
MQDWTEKNGETIKSAKSIEERRNVLQREGEEWKREILRWEVMERREIIVLSEKRKRNSFLGKKREKKRKRWGYFRLHQKIN